MKRRILVPIALLLGSAAIGSSQTGCPCGPVELQPVPARATVMYTGGTGPAGPVSRPGALVPLPSSLIAPPTVSPPGYVSYRPLIPIVSNPSSYYVGRGIIGQPKVYVPGQPVRNFFRYLSP